MKIQKTVKTVTFLLSSAVIGAALLSVGAEAQGEKGAGGRVVQTNANDPPPGRGAPPASARRGNAAGAGGGGRETPRSGGASPPTPSGGRTAGREVPHGGIIPTTPGRPPRVHTPLPRGPEVARPEFPNIAPHAFRGRDFAHFTPQERGIWQSGRWRHESHNGHLGWWWVVGGAWYFYPEPIYPYPTIVSDYLYPVPRIISPQFWYYCDDPPGYYPEVPACYDAWQLIPMSPPAPLPGAIGPEASADIRAGYRIARDVCAACHVVHPTQASASILVQPGPRFEDVANRPDTTIDSLRNFISTTGWDLESRPITMPNQGLSEQSTREVATYILSLRKQH